VSKSHTEEIVSGSGSAVNQLNAALAATGKSLSSAADSVSAKFPSQLKLATANLGSWMDSVLREKRSGSEDVFSGLERTIATRQKDSVSESSLVRKSFPTIQAELGNILRELELMAGSATGGIGPVLEALAANETTHASRKILRTASNLAGNITDFRTRLVGEVNAKRNSNIASLQDQSARGTELVGKFQDRIKAVRSRANSTLDRLSNNVLDTDSVVRNLTKVSARLETRFSDLTQNAFDLKNSIQSRAQESMNDVLKYFRQSEADLDRVDVIGLDNETLAVKDASHIFSSKLRDWRDQYVHEFDQLESIAAKQNEKYSDRLIDVLSSLTGMNTMLKSSAVGNVLMMAEKEGKLSDIVAEYIIAVQTHQGDVVDFETFVKYKMGMLTNMSSAELARLAGLVNKTVDELGTAHVRSSLEQEQYLSNLVNKFSPGIGAGSAELNGAGSSLDESMKGFMVGIGKSTGDSQSVAGLWGKLTAKSKHRLATIIDKLRGGELNFNEALSQAHEVNAKDIRSSADALWMLTGMVDNYAAGLLSAFNGSESRLEKGEIGIEQKLNVSVPPLLERLEGVSAKVDDLGDSIDRMSGHSAEQDSEEAAIDALQNTIQAVQSNITQLISSTLQTDIDSFERDMQSAEQDYEEYVANLTAKAVDYMDSKGSYLRSKLHVNPASSLLQDIASHVYGKKV
jgi:phage shock protein A